MDPLHPRDDRHLPSEPADPAGRTDAPAELDGSAARLGPGLPLPRDAAGSDLGPDAVPAAEDAPERAPEAGPTHRLARAAATAARSLERSTAAVRRTAHRGADAARRTARRRRAAGAARVLVPDAEPFTADRPSRRGPVLAVAGATAAALLWTAVRIRARHGG